MTTYRNPRTMKRKLIKMQIFHGKVKGINYPKGAETFMELGAGKLNDLLNWEAAGVERVYAIEIDKKSVEEGHKKYEKYKDGHNLPRVITKVADVTREADEIMGDFAELRHSIDHIICNFSIHYFLRDRKAVNNLLKIVTFFLKIGGTFRFTTLDGRKIYNMFQILCAESDDPLKKEVVKNEPVKYNKKSKAIEFKRGKITFFRITRRFDCYEKFHDYGQPIDVYVLSIGKGHREYLVNIQYISEILMKKGIYTTDIIPFEEYAKKGPLKKYAKRLSRIEKEYSFLNVFCNFVRRS